MAYAPLRSLNAELDEGATDGKYKKVVTDRGGRVDPDTYEERQALADTWFGIHEAPVKMRPDGKLVLSPDYQSTKPVRYRG